MNVPARPTGLAVTYHLDPGDIRALMDALHRPAWGALHWGRYERLRRVLAGAALGGLVFVLIKAYAQRMAGIDLVPWLDGLGAVGGGAFLGWWWGGRQRPNLAPDAPQFQTRSIALDEDGLSVRGEGFDTHIDWTQVTPIRQVGEYLLIGTRWAGHQVVPLRAFASPEAVAEFIERLRTLREAALRPPTAPPPQLPIETLRYRLTRDDVRAFFALGGEPRGWRAALIYLLLFPCMGLVAAWNAGADDATWWTGFALGIGAAWALARLILFIDRRIAIARYPLAEGEAELQRWGGHLAVIADGRTELVAYERIGKVVTTNRHVFVMSPAERAIIIPLRAFAGEAEMRAFAEEVDRLSRESAD